ncbi:MAG: hypothetical protein ABIR57_12150 [Aeromicrobium sp.]
MRFAGMAVAFCLLLSGCGGGNEPKASKSPASKSQPSTAKATATKKPTIAVPTGVSALEDLSDFRCAANSKGVWNASGILQNRSKKALTYQVSVFVGRANGKDGKALTKQYASINAHGSIKIKLTKIPAAKDAKQCYVQVLAK